MGFGQQCGRMKIRELHYRQAFESLGEILHGQIHAADVRHADAFVNAEGGKTRRRGGHAEGHPAVLLHEGVKPLAFASG